MEETKTAAELWFVDLLNEIANHDTSMMVPSNPSGQNETTVGVVEDEYLRKAFSLGLFLARERDRNRLEAAYASSEEEKKQLMTSAITAGEKATLLFRFFWAYVRESIDVFDQRMLSVREGWKVVSFDATRPPNIFEVLFGGPGGPAGQE